MGSDDLYKKERAKRELRKQSTRGKIKDSILILCEGEKTEPNYFNSFRTDLQLKNVKIDGCGTNTDKLVEKAFQNLNDFDQIWCVFDRDSFPPHNFNRAFQLAEKHKQIRIAYSNEAFELWYLLHFHYCDTGLHRDQYTEKLTDLLGFKYQKNSKSMYDKLSGMQETARNNARKLLENHPDPNDNPSTTVHLLVQELNKYKK